MEISRRGFLAGMGALGMPFGESRTQGFSNPPLARIIVANTIINKNGLFLYSGPPAFGNLIQSIGVAASGSDKFNNAYLAGNTTYLLISGTYYAVQQIGRGHTFLTAPAANGPWSNIASIFPVAAGPLNINSSGNIVLNANNAANQILAEGNIATFNAGVADPWHAASLNAGFTNAGFGAGTSFQHEPIGGGRVRLRGSVSLTANEIAGTIVFTLPAGYVPVANQFFTTVNSLSGFSASTGSVKVDSSGNVSINCAGSNGNFVMFDGIVIELD